MGLSLADSFVTRRTRKGNFLNQIDQLIDWAPIEKTIAQHYAPVSDVTGRPAYPGLLLFKMLLVGLWHGGLSDESVEDMANANLHVMRFLGLDLEDDVPDHSVLSRFRTRLTKAQAWDDLLEQINRQIQAHQITVTKGCHIDASITHSPRKPRDYGDSLLNALIMPYCQHGSLTSYCNSRLSTSCDTRW